MYSLRVTVINMKVGRKEHFLDEKIITRTREKENSVSRYPYYNKSTSSGKSNNVKYVNEIN